MRISTQLLAGYLLMAVLFVAVVMVNYQLSARVLRSAQRVAESQYVTSQATRYYRQIVDMETGFRGFLLTGREESLEPYYEGDRQLPDVAQELWRLTPTDSPQRARLREVAASFDRWLQFSRTLISEKRVAQRRDSAQEGLQGMPHAHLSRNLVGKRLLDAVRRGIRAFEAHEERRRASQAEKLATAITDSRTTSVLLTIAGIGLGLLLALLTARRLTRRINRQVRWATRLAGGDYTVRIAPDTTGDELTHLNLALDQMADTMTSSIAQLQDRNRELDQFAYIVSHDLKAPLRGLESVSRWIEEDYRQLQEVPPHIQEFLRLMRLRVHRMENLIAGILALSRVDRAEELRERVDVGELLQELVEDLAPPPGFTVRLPPETPVLWTVRTHLAQVFQNLLSNAVKYHDQPAQGTATVTWRATATHHVFAITDDGPGIAPEYHERIFQIFQTLQARDTVESTGVGLSIVKKIVERHGGTVRVASAEGRGATFTFTWPLAGEAPPVMPAPATSAE